MLPVLLDGAQMPKINQLPHDLMALTLFQGMPLRVESVVQDAEAIARRLRIMLDQRRRGGVPAWMGRRCRRIGPAGRWRCGRSIRHRRVWGRRQACFGRS